MASNDWKKMTVYDASGMNRHNGKEQRVNGEHENKHIDKTKSHLNMYIGCDDYSEAYYNMRTRVKEVDKLYPPKRKKKADDRIICAMIEVPCPQEIYDKGYDAAKQFFYDVYELYKDFFGAENLHGGFVHFDEVHEYTYKDGTKRMSLPHMHALVSAYAEWTDTDKKTGATTDRKGINGKHFETRGRMKELNKIVDDYCLEIFKVKFLTGETPQRKSVEQLKAEDELHQLSSEIEIRRSEADRLEKENDILKETMSAQQQKSDAALQDALHHEQAAKDKADEIKRQAEEQAQQILSEAQQKKSTAEKELHQLTTKIEAGRSEADTLTEKISVLQQEIFSITLPDTPVPPSKPTSPRPTESKEKYVQRIIDDSLRGLKKMSEEKKLAKEYDCLIDEWNNFDSAMKQYSAAYSEWVQMTGTVTALQARLEEVARKETAIENGQRTIYFQEELKQKRQMKELQKKNAELQSELESIRNQIWNLAEQEYQQRRKHDAEVIAYYEQYCGISPDGIEDAVMEQRKQDYDSD